MGVIHDVKRYETPMQKLQVVPYGIEKDHSPRVVFLFSPGYRSRAADHPLLRLCGIFVISQFIINAGFTRFTNH